MLICLYCIERRVLNDHDHEGPLRTTELNTVELDTSGNYRDRTSHNKKTTLFGKFVESGVKHQTQ
jgi:hypothetical protein